MRCAPVTICFSWSMYLEKEERPTTLPLDAQWLNYPTPSVPRAPDSKPNLTAPRRALTTASRISPGYGLLGIQSRATRRKASIC